MQFFTISFLRDLFNFVNSYTLLNNFEKLINNSVYKLFFFRRYYLLTKDKNKKLPGWNQRILFIHTRFLGTNFLQLFNLYLLYHSRCFPFVFDLLITREWLSDLVDEFSLKDMLNGLPLFFGLQQIIPYWGDLRHFLLGWLSSF